MTARPLAEMLRRRRPLILDGAMGTELHRLGADIQLPLWSGRAVMDHPDLVIQIHRSHIAAGADIITTDTFRTNRRTFQHAGFEDRSREHTSRAVALAEESRDAFPDRRVLVAGSVGPLEDCYRPDLVPPDDQLCDEHTEHASRLAVAGVDFLLIETMSTIREAYAACEAAVHTGKEVLVSFLCRHDGNLYGGESLEDAVRTISALQPAGFSLNCISPRHVDTPLIRLLALTTLPIAVYANVGKAGAEQGDDFIVDVGPEEYGMFAQRWIDRGVSIVGGCCGTTPAHTASVTTKARRHKEI